MRATTTEYFIIRTVGATGGKYLTSRKSRVNMNQPAYRWIKSSRSAASRFTSYDAARKVAYRYGGTPVRCAK